ncbi:MAG TPA: class I SAM-dependent methyltransferase [Vicinamibacterales bacterium]
MTSARFVPVDRCWVCDATTRATVHDASFDLSAYAVQDPDLAAYSGMSVPIVRCARCGFAQPQGVPALPRYFDRMYDQRWSDDWIAHEHQAEYKDLIFDDILSALGDRLGTGRRRLLDIGAHAGRFIALARRAGWNAEGLELNPKTAAFASAASGGQVHQGNMHTFDPAGVTYDAITLTDVLEHVPEPRLVLQKARCLLAPGGWIAIKVPNAPAQRIKERTRAIVRPGYKPSLADNLVHVNHFSPSSLRFALEREEYCDVAIHAGAPELSQNGFAGSFDRTLRLVAFRTVRALPGGVHTPLAFNLQAYARRG